MSTSSKIKIRVGAIEVEYEGSEAFLKEELPALLAAVSKLHNENAGRSGGDEQGDANANGKKPSTNGGPIKGTTGTYAAKLDCKSGTDLLVAAAAHLTFDAEQEKFSRKDLLAAAKTASNYYKRTVSNNLTKYLGILVADDSLREIGSGIYSLSAAKKKALESQLAEA